MNSPSPKQFPKKKFIRRYTFSEDDDIKLSCLVGKYGLENWNSISQEMKNRTPRQCRDRWVDYLDPEVSHSLWTPEEDKLLLECFQRYGNKWRKISSHFQNHNQVSVRNRFRMLCAGKQELISSKNHNSIISSPEFVFQLPEQKLYFGGIVEFSITSDSIIFFFRDLILF
jgi:hypothetical protein